MTKNEALKALKLMGSITDVKPVSPVNRNETRRRLFDKYFERLPGFAIYGSGHHTVAIYGHQPRAERRKLACAFAAGDWRNAEMRVLEGGK